MENNKWLEHLDVEMLREVRNDRFCSYLIALEGWRRGLELTFHSEKVTNKGLHSPGLAYELKLKDRTHKFYKARGDKVKGDAFRIGSNKYRTKQWLSEHGIPVAKGKEFSETAGNDEIINYAREIGFPVVLKPVVGAQGKGVVANIHDEEYLKDSLIYVREKLNRKKVLLEQHIHGSEYRVYVMADNVICVINRIPANIIGDGIHTIKELIEMKNNLRKKNPRLYTCLIKVDFEILHILERLNYSLDDVPQKGKQIFLREKSNVSTGGDSEELTDSFPDEVKQIAINALKSIDDFPHGGVDIIYNPDGKEDNRVAVLELGPTPQIGSLVFPIKGRGRDVPASIIDYYFPETIGLSNNNPKMYFDLKNAIYPLMNKSVSRITVSPCPDKIEKQIKYIVRGKVQKVGFRYWIRKKALEKDLHGYAQNLRDGTLEIAIAGEEVVVNSFIETCKQGPNRAQVTEVLEKEWDGPLNVGFKIMPNFKKSAKKISKNTSSQNTAQSNFLEKVKRKLVRILK